MKEGKDMTLLLASRSTTVQLLLVVLLSLFSCCCAQSPSMWLPYNFTACDSGSTLNSSYTVCTNGGDDAPWWTAMDPEDEGVQVIQPTMTNVSGAVAYNVAPISFKASLGMQWVQAARTNRTAAQRQRSSSPLATFLNETKQQLYVGCGFVTTNMNSNYFTSTHDSAFSYVVGYLVGTPCGLSPNTNVTYRLVSAADYYRASPTTAAAALRDDTATAAGGSFVGSMDDDVVLILQTRTQLVDSDDPSPGGLINIASQLHLAASGNLMRVVVRELRFSASTYIMMMENLGNNMVLNDPGLEGQYFNATPSTSRQQQGTAPSNDWAVVNLTGALTVTVARNAITINQCLKFETCSTCLANRNVDFCSWIPLLNGGVCLPSTYANTAYLELDTVTNANCPTVANVSHYGPCYGQSQSCLMTNDLDDAEVREALVPQSSMSVFGEHSTTTSLSSNSQISVKGVVPPTLTRNIRAPAKQIDLGVMYIPYGFMLSWGIEGVVSVNLPADENTTVLYTSVAARTSRWCYPPFITAVPSAPCTVEQFIVLLDSMMVDVVEYYPTSGVVAVHTMLPDKYRGRVAGVSAPGMVATNLTFFPPFLYSSFVNRSYYFIPAYASTSVCAHGTWATSAQLTCVCDVGWEGEQCDMPVGWYAAVDSTGIDSTRWVECPDCGPFGNCTAAGVCACLPGYGGPRCELPCSSTNQGDAINNCLYESVAVCSACVCDAGRVALSAEQCTARSECTFDNETGALLVSDSASCGGTVPSTGQTPSPSQQRSGVNTQSAVWTTMSGLAAVAALAVCALVVSITMQVKRIRRVMMSS